MPASDGAAAAHSHPAAAREEVRRAEKTWVDCTSGRRYPERFLRYLMNSIWRYGVSRKSSAAPFDL